MENETKDSTMVKEDDKTKTTETVHEQSGQPATKETEKTVEKKD